jgi:hypothetical protein
MVADCSSAETPPRSFGCSSGDWFDQPNQASPLILVQLACRFHLPGELLFPNNLDSVSRSMPEIWQAFAESRKGRAFRTSRYLFKCMRQHGPAYGPNTAGKDNPARAGIARLAFSCPHLPECGSSISRNEGRMRANLLSMNGLRAISLFQSSI